MSIAISMLHRRLSHIHEFALKKTPAIADDERYGVHGCFSNWQPIGVCLIEVVVTRTIHQLTAICAKVSVFMALSQQIKLSSTERPRRRRLLSLLLNVSIARRLALGILIPALLALLTLTGVAVESQQLLSHTSTLYQHLIHTYVSLNADLATLDQMHQNLLGTLNDAGQTIRGVETLQEDQNTLHQLETTFASTLDSYRQQDLLAQYPDLAALFTKTGHGSQVTQQSQLAVQAQSAWQGYREVQDGILASIARGDVDAAQAQEVNKAEQAYASSETTLLRLISFNNTLIPSIHDATQLDEIILLVLLALMGLCFVLGTCVVVLLVFRTVVQRLHTMSSWITLIEGGQIGTRLPIDGRDEIASVSGSVNSMLDQIVGLLDETTRQRDALASAEELKHLHEELQAQHEALNKANERLAALATTDPLTGLPNHRAVMNRLEEEVARARRTDKSFALLFLDVDHFKSINDTWGHLAGDAVLCEVGRRLEQGIRVEDFAGRYGGEEFAVVLTNTKQVRDACEVAERLRLSLVNTPCIWEGEEDNTTVSIPVTASFGVAVFGEHATLGEALLEAADSAMYEAKHNGRNRVCVAGEEMEVVEQLVAAGGGEQTVSDVIALRALAAMANAHDRETGAHARRVVLLAEATARELGCALEEQYLVRLAALLHDIGKVGVSDEILHKPGPLTEEEWAVMRRHPKIGHQILAQAGGKFELLSHIVVAHHERWDGKGYPYGLSHEAIPLGARILAVVDSFDAMTSDRSYRKALPEQEAQAELQRCAGSQYDPRVVDAFCRTLDNASWKEVAISPTLQQVALLQEP